MNADKKIKFLLDVILFYFYMEYQDEFTNEELESGKDISEFHQNYGIYKNWIEDIKVITSEQKKSNVIISNHSVSSGGKYFFSYTNKTEQELYNYIINVLSERYVKKNNLKKDNIREAIEDVEENLFDLYKHNLSTVNKIIIDISQKYEVFPVLKRPLLTVV